MELTTDQISEKVKQHFNGTDPLHTACSRMPDMSIEELQTVILVAGNRIGSMIRGKEYSYPVDAAIHMSAGLDLIFSAYDSAVMDNSSNCEAGSSVN